MLICSQCKTVLGVHSTVCPVDGGVPERIAKIPPGALLGGYRVEKLLGEGAMGFVYEATHEVLGRRCALKVLRPEFAKANDVVTRFLQEAKAVNVINHRHIVNVYDYGDEIEGLVYFVMEYLEGETLAVMMKTGAMPPALLLHVFTQILQGLAAAHSKQIIHRDLKPENVFVIKRTGNPVFVKLLDFGVAKLRGEGAVEGLTGAGALIGTPHFMSPEQFRGKPVDTRSDIFSLGIMMYAAATGRMPFQGEDLSVLALGIIKETPTRIGDLVPGFPPSLGAIIDKALAKEPDQRFADAADMLRALGDVVKVVDADRAAIIELLRERVGDANADIEPVSERSWEDVSPAQVVTRGADTGGAFAGLTKSRMLIGGGVLALVAAGGLGIVLSRPSQESAATTRAPVALASGTGESAPLDLRSLAAQERSADLRELASRQMNELWEQSDAAARSAFVDALAEVGGAATEDLLIRGLQEAPQTLVRAAQALANLGSTTSTAPLFAALQASGAQLETDLAASLLALGDERAEAVLRASLNRSRSKFAAALALVTKGGDRSPATTQILRTVFNETPPWKGHWLEAAGGLLTVEDEAAEGALLAALADDAKPGNQVAAAALLARHEQPAGLDKLSAIVADARSQVRGQAALALARSAHDDAQLYVPVGLMSDEPGAQVTAIAILSRLGGAELARQSPRLAAMAQDESERVVVRFAALAALASLPD